MILTICGTGIRVSELKFITVDALKSGKVQIHLRGKTVLFCFPKNYVETESVCEYSVLSVKGPVFQTRSGKPLDRSNICHEMKQICEEAKVDREKVFPHQSAPPVRPDILQGLPGRGEIGRCVGPLQHRNHPDLPDLHWRGA